MKISKEDKTMVIMASVMVLMLVTLLQFGHAQTTNYEAPLEDQVIVCVSGNVIETSGDLCKLYNVDGDGYFKQDITLDMVQKDLYQNPNSDTFIMDLRD